MVYIILKGGQAANTADAAMEENDKMKEEEKNISEKAEDTWSIKVSESVKKGLADAFKNSGKTGQEFARFIVNLCNAEEWKKKDEKVASDIEELMELASRMTNVFKNMADRNACHVDTMKKELQNVKEEGTKILEESKAEVNKIKTEIKEKTDTIKVLESKISDLEAIIKKKDEEISRFNFIVKEREELKEKNEKVKIEFEKLKELETIARSENDSLKSKMKNMEEDFKSKKDIYIKETENKFKEALLETKEKYQEKIDELREKIIKKKE